ncbi:MAG: formate dehydrogenase accessory sulfurtransferase FdhD [Desulfobacterales bacterium]|nr:formate dehydrogenase accessory sulfurtransferase FdhD [Desulfobacterales bacterium]
MKGPERPKTRVMAPPEDLIKEEPLSIRIQGNPYSVVMRTPEMKAPCGRDSALARGSSIRQRISPRSPSATERDANVVTVTLSPARRRQVEALLQRRGFISQTSCGICGKELIEDLKQAIRPLKDATRIHLDAAQSCVHHLSRHQPLRRQTRSSHAAAIYDAQARLLAVAEDVGRHNALDKAIGKVLLDGGIQRAAFVVLSSRVSYELVQKTARARIPIILAVSRPTALAVDLASQLNMAIGFFSARIRIPCLLRRGAHTDRLKSSHRFWGRRWR